LHLANAYLPPRRIDFFDFMADADIDPLFLPECFRSPDNERIFIVDNPADIVGNPSGGIRYVRAPLENDDLKVRTATFGLGGGAHPRRIAADNNQPFRGHGFCSFQ
jgi:hypothetical protein